MTSIKLPCDVTRSNIIKNIVIGTADGCLDWDGKLTEITSYLALMNRLFMSLCFHDNVNNGNIFRLTGPLWGETVDSCRWFVMPSRSLWCNCNASFRRTICLNLTLLRCITCVYLGTDCGGGGGGCSCLFVCLVLFFSLFFFGGGGGGGGGGSGKSQTFFFVG